MLAKFSEERFLKIFIGCSLCALPFALVGQFFFPHAVDALWFCLGVLFSLLNLKLIATLLRGLFGGTRSPGIFVLIGFAKTLVVLGAVMFLSRMELKVTLSAVGGYLIFIPTSFIYRLFASEEG